MIMNNEVVSNSIPDPILEDIKQAVASKEYGSVEIYIESGRVVQITERTIKKTERLNSDNGSSVRMYRNR